MGEIFVVWGDFSLLPNYSAWSSHCRPAGSPVVDSSGREGAGLEAHFPPIRGSRVSRNNEEMCVCQEVDSNGCRARRGWGSWRESIETTRWPTIGNEPNQGEKWRLWNKILWGCKRSLSMDDIPESFYSCSSINTAGLVGNHADLLWLHNSGLGNPHWLVKSRFYWFASLLTIFQWEQRLHGDGELICPVHCWGWDPQFLFSALTHSRCSTNCRKWKNEWWPSGFVCLYFVQVWIFDYYYFFLLLPGLP